MPRAFLITHRRYNGTEEFENSGRDYSPERGVRLGEYGGGHPTSDGVSDCGSETSSECPEELYNLTKLAEVSLAAAAGTLIHPGKVSSYEDELSSRWKNEALENDLMKQITEKGGAGVMGKNVENEDSRSDLSLRERTRLFFERIETEREILETINKSRKTPEPEVGVIMREKGCIIGSNGSLTSGRIENDNNSRENDEKIISEMTIKKTSTTTTTTTTTTNLSRRISFVSSSESSKSDDSEEHECPDCGKKYSTSSNLARHRQTHRSLGDKKARRCPHCDKIYVSMPAFSMHVRTHNQGCKCHYCGKCFSRPWLLQGHIRTHTGEKPFKCTICNKAFADKSNLRAHVQTHSNTKPHVCGRCGKAFALKSYLYKHEESSCMRAHNRGSTSSEIKMDSSNEAVVKSNNLSKILETPMTSSPTSVIVQRPLMSRISSPTSFSTIIRHTKNPCGDNNSRNTAPKRQCRDEIFHPDDSQNSKDSERLKPTELFSRMVIRTSVISPNPEHLAHLSASLNVKKNPPFDFNDPTRTSAFSRPNGMSLNLGIA